MESPNIFEKAQTEQLIKRLDNLQVNTQPNWGKMNAAQMLAHLNEPYELAKKNEYKKPNFLKAWLLNKFVKPMVVGEKPYSKNGPTAPEFKITGERNFEQEMERLKKNMTEVQEKGEDFFEGHNSASFGPLSAKEWNRLFHKHLDHHFNQFGI